MRALARTEKRLSIFLFLIFLVLFVSRQKGLGLRGQKEIIKNMLLAKSYWHFRS